MSREYASDAAGGVPSGEYFGSSFCGMGGKQSVPNLFPQGASGDDMAALSAVLTHRSRVGLLAALKPCDKTIPAIAAQLRQDVRTVRHHAEVLRSYGLLRKYTRRLKAIRKRGDKTLVMYSLTSKGTVAAQFYQVI